jgi:hypothetical protein
MLRDPLEGVAFMGSGSSLSRFCGRTKSFPNVADPKRFMQIAHRNSLTFRLRNFTVSCARFL